MGLILPIGFLGLMASLSPATIVVFVLVLGTARPRVNAAAFLIGWGLSLTLVFAGSYALATTDATQTENGRTSVAVLEVVLGVALLGFAARVWRRERNADRPPMTPNPGGGRLMGHIAGLNPVGAAVIGILKQPWAITTAAALVVVHNQATGLRVLIAFVLFTVASTATVLVMFLYFTRNPAAASMQLTLLRERVVAAGPAMGAAAALLVGALLLVTGLIHLN